MGSNWSSLEREPLPDPWWPAAQQSDDTIQCSVDKEEAAEVLSRKDRGRVREEELESFKQELAHKRALRHEAIAALQAEMRDLREKVEEERKLRQKAEEERDNLMTSTGDDLRIELEKEREEKKNLLEERERLREEIEEKHGLERQVQALKDVSEIGKEMLRIRELQVKELKKKLVEINISSVMEPPEDLRVEYEQQIENIRKLRTLYEERAAATLIKHQQELEREQARITVLETKLSDLQKETIEYKEAKKELEEKIEKLESAIQHKDDELEETKDILFSSTAQNQSLNSQMTLINYLFSQMLVSPKVDLDRLTRLLKENHGLIADLTEKGDSNDVAALLVDLAGQVEKEQETEQNEELIIDNVDENTELKSEIATNLSKVWRVMIELLSHHQSSSHTEMAGGAESCYKCIETPTGPRSVISVSQTFLTLKDLILEKNRLVKEVGRLKTLNSHLEHRLGSQEKRLSVVTTELRKTWGVVNKLKAQHKQLHTHEKILRYELQQKRCMLTELKEELEHCRDKWERARQKNTQTEEDWKKLRKEFAARKSRKESNSAESGYEEDEVAQSPPLESISNGRDFYEIKQNDGSEPELSEEDIEHSDGNSFDTVIDLLDIACIENQTEGEIETPFALCDVTSQPLEISPSLLPLSGSEFTEGLDQIESEDLAAVLDIQYQNQLLGADYNLSLPSSSGSSPVPTENDDFASSEMDNSEEDSLSNGNHIHSLAMPFNNVNVSEERLLFGSNSSKNISRFLEGLFVEENQNENLPDTSQTLTLALPSTSQISDENDSATPLINNENSTHFSLGSATPLVNTDKKFEFPQNDEVLAQDNKKVNRTEVQENQIEQFQPNSSSLNLEELKNTEENCIKLDLTLPSSSCDEGRNLQEEMLNAREEKLKKLERQCRSLVSKVSSTSFRSEIISNKIDELHLCYASSGEVSDVEEDIATEETEDHENKTQTIKSTEQTNINGLDDANLVSVKPLIHEESSLSQTKIISSSSTCEQPCQNSSPLQKRTPEEILEARAARLKRLEDQCKSLFSKMSATSSRSDLISNKLDELHESYGSSDQAVSSVENNVTNNCFQEKSASYSNNLQENKFHSNEMKPILIKDNIRDPKPPDLVSESKEILNKCATLGPSVEPTTILAIKKNRTPEEILEARAERFKRLEDQCKSLVSKMTATSLRSEIISNKLDELHSCYGSSEDASDSEEHSSSSKKSTPTSSPRYNRKLIRAAELTKDQSSSSSSNESIKNTEFNEALGLKQPIITNSETICSVTAKRTPEEILQARAQRLDRLEEQCKSLFSKMSATSQRSDVISNRLEELHDQYGQTSNSEDRNHERIPSSTISEVEVVRLEKDQTSRHSDTEKSDPSHNETKDIEGTSSTGAEDDRSQQDPIKEKCD